MSFRTQHDGRTKSKQERLDALEKKVRRRYEKYKNLVDALDNPDLITAKYLREMEETVASEETAAGKETGAHHHIAVVDGKLLEMESAISENMNYPSLYQPKPGESISSRLLHVSMILNKLPEIDLRDYDQVVQRVDEYLQIHETWDLKPTLNGLALALGVNRYELTRITNGGEVVCQGKRLDIDPRIRSVIKQYVAVLSTMWEGYMQNGQINPVSGIFLGKNHFGYTDKTEVAIYRAPDQDSGMSVETLRDKYAVPRLSAETPTIELSDSYDSTTMTQTQTETETDTD